MKKYTIRTVISAAVIAALYVVLTLAFSAISYGMIQFRLSEVLVALVFFDPAAALPGLCAGCAIANMVGPGAFYDAIIGTAASALGLYAILICKKHGGKPVVGFILYSVINAVIVAVELGYITGAYAGYSFIMLFLWVFIGEAVTAVGGGMGLYTLLKKRWKDISGETTQSEEQR